MNDPSKAQPPADPKVRNGTPANTGKQAPHPALLLYDPALEEKDRTALIESVRQTLGLPDLPTRAFDPAETAIPDDAVLYLAIPDDAFRRWLPQIAQRPCTLVLLPYGGNPLQQEFYAIPGKIEDALKLAEKEGIRAIGSYFACNGECQLQIVTLAPSRWYTFHRLSQLLRGLFDLRLRALNLRTAKEQEIKTAALMVELGHESLLTRKRAYFFKDAENQCRRVSAVVYAPQSILGAIKQRLYLARKQKNSTETLPRGIGTFQSRSLRFRLADGTPLPLIVGHEYRESVTEILGESIETQCMVLSGISDCTGGEDKESIRNANLPTGDDAIAFFTKKTLPLIPVADEESFARLLTKLRDASRLHNSYLILLILSVLMATTGLFQNSSPTIIGAMILAPLMAPIIAFTMGMVRLDAVMMRQSASTVFLSVLLALGAAALFTWLTPFDQLTDQMAARTNPTLLDLAVAIFSGFAAAYGYANSKVGESLAGVAIAVALVPPLCVSGIGIGWGSWPIFSHALLLFATNIVGIVVAAGTMFYLLGFASRRYAVSKALSLKLVVVALIAVPLWFSTRILLTEEAIYRELATVHTLQVGSTPVEIEVRGLHHRKEGYDVMVTVLSPKPLDTARRKEIARILKQRLHEHARIILGYEESY
ncbi:TIGR00341 family protein [Nitratifractor sp.]